MPRSSAVNGITTHQYDALDELTQEQSARNGAWTNTFGYDAAFNPTDYRDQTGLA